MNWSEYMAEPALPIIEAMKKMNRNSRGIVYVCAGKKLLGALTDGDIRRFMVKRGNLERPVSDIANMHPKYVRVPERAQAENIMKQWRIRSLPVVNEAGEIQEICFASEGSVGDRPNLGLPVAIMAGGKGTRLYPYTQVLPKPLIPIGDKTITEHIMDRFQAYGCTHFDVIVNYKKNFIKAYFQENETPRDVSFIDEIEFLGTGGGLKLLRGRYSSSFFMSNCDILIDADYADMVRCHRESGNLVTMVCAKKRLILPYGTVEVTESGKALRLSEKPELSFTTNTGLYILEPEFLEMIPEHTFIHITDVIQSCICAGRRIGIYPVEEESWLDMGQMDELERMKKQLLR